MVKLFSREPKYAGKAIVWVHRSRYAIYPRLAWNYARPNGGPVLKTEKSWRHINGVLFRVGQSTTWVTFRRFWRL